MRGWIHRASSLRENALVVGCGLHLNGKRLGSICIWSHWIMFKDCTVTITVVASLKVWEIYSSVYGLMVRKLSVIHGMALVLLHTVLSNLETSLSYQSNIIALFFQHREYSLHWIVASELLRKKYKWWFSKSRPYLANIFKVTYWQYPCVDECVKTNIFASVHFKSCASRIWLESLSDSLSTPSPIPPLPISGATQISAAG